MNDFLLSLYWEVLPALLQLFGVFVGVVLVRVGNVARARWGIEIEAKHREALQSALMTGAAMALAKGLGGKDAVSEVLQHVLTRGAPDAAKFFGLDPRSLEGMAQAKLRENIGGNLDAGISILGELKGVNPEAIVDIHAITGSLAASIHAEAAAREDAFSSAVARIDRLENRLDRP